MKNDRFLIGILVGIGVLVIVALGLFFLRSGKVGYLPDGTPEATVHNFTVALSLADYQRAYNYLAEDKGKPDYAKFKDAFLLKQVNPTDASLRVDSSSVSGDNAAVEVTIINTSTDPFSGPYRNIQKATLVRQSGQWRLREMPYPFWGFDWYQIPQEQKQ